MIGAAGIWDQRSFRQTRVHGYSRAIGTFRPLINQWSRLIGGIELPRVGQSLDACFVCFPVVIDHGYGLLSLYGHLSSISVEEGQSVERYEAIGRSGQTAGCDGDSVRQIEGMRGRST